MKTLRITARDQLAPYIAPIQGANLLAIDTETTGLDPHQDRLRLIQIAARGLPVLVIDCELALPSCRDALRAMLCGKAPKLMHNAKFDLAFLRAAGLSAWPVLDTMLAALLLKGSGGPDRTSLAALSQHYLGQEMDKRLQVSDWTGALTDDQIEYAAKDASALLRLWDQLKPELDRTGQSAIFEIESACAQALARMEWDGIHLDTARWSALTRQVERERESAIESLYPYIGEPVRQTTLWGEDRIYTQNLDSNPFVMSLLKRHGIVVKSTARYDLFPFRNEPLVRCLTAYRRAQKALSSFLYPFTAAVHPRTGRLHPRYYQIAAASGRMSCDSPNIQQVPRDAAYRACFTAPAGRKLVLADYSQIELRVAAQIAGDSRMIQAYREGRDLHLLTASLLAGKAMDQVTKAERQSAKAVNFGLVFGMGPAGLQAYAEQTYGAQMSLPDAERFHRRYFEAYTGIAHWHRALKHDPPKEDRTLAGRLFRYPAGVSLPIATNFPVQGTAADITKRALGLLSGRLPKDTKMVGVVHDEILLEADEGAAELAAEVLRQTMEEAGNAILPDVPVVAEARVAESWAEK